VGLSGVQNKLRLTGGVGGQAVASIGVDVFDFFEKAFASMRDGCTKSDGHKLRPADQGDAIRAALDTQRAGAMPTTASIFAERLCIEGSI
jgi:hypothetical protein